MALYYRTEVIKRTLMRASIYSQKGRVLFVPVHERDRKPTPPTYDPFSGWTDKSVRTGLIATKLGMMHDWNEWGEMLPLTVLRVENCQVLQVKTRVKDGVDSIQLGAQDKKLKNTHRAQMGHFARAGVPPKRTIMEFPITPDAAIPVGMEIKARHLLPGQFIDAAGITKGKGFQGGMKRWGFRGQDASHGVSLAHRSIGSTGARKDPGKVWKGKKMPGRMGGKRATMRNLKIFEVWPDKNLILVKGAIPGAEGTQIRVRDATGKKFFAPPPFPTYFPTPGKPEPQFLRGSFPKPWDPSIEAEGVDEEKFKRVLTDPIYRAKELARREEATAFREKAEAAVKHEMALHRQLEKRRRKQRKKADDEEEYKYENEL